MNIKLIEKGKSIMRMSVVNVYSLGHIGLNENAYSEEDVLIIIEQAFKENLLVLGGDVYSLKDNKVYVTFDSWYYEGNNMKESVEKAWNYIKNYSRENEGEFLYSVVLSKTQE